MKKVLIIGGTGFFGKSLISELIQEYEITVLLRNEEGKEKIKFFGDRVKIIKGDFFEPEGFLNKIEEFYVVFQFAPSALIGANYDEEYSKKIIDSNKKIIKECSQKNVKFVYTSSVIVYGNCDDEIITEDSNTSPNVLYAETKLFVEREILNEAKLNSDFKYVILRNSNVYGPNQNLAYRTVIVNFILKALENEVLEIKGSSNQTRDFIYIDDVVSACKKIIEVEKSGVYNLSSSTSISLVNLAKLIIKLTNSNSEIKVDSENVENQIKQKVVSSTKLMQDFSWSPVVGLKEGVIKTIDYVRVENAK